MKPHYLVAIVAVSVLPVTCLGLSRVAKAQTKVDPTGSEGRDITIIVPIDAAGPAQIYQWTDPAKKTADGRPLIHYSDTIPAAYRTAAEFLSDKTIAAEVLSRETIAILWEKGADQVWNDAFNGPANPYAGCLNLKLKANVKPVDTLAPPDPKRHKIYVLLETVGPTEAPGEVISGSGKDPYKEAWDGYFDPLFYDPKHAKAVAHEVGHLIGLKDEYTPSVVEAPVTKEKRRITTPHPGREHTLMAQWGGQIDDVLIDNLVKRIHQERRTRPQGDDVRDCPKKRVCVPPDPSTFERMRWGKWRGQISVDNEGDDPLPYLCSMSPSGGGCGGPWRHSHQTGVAGLEFVSAPFPEFEKWPDPEWLYEKPARGFGYLRTRESRGTGHLVIDTHYEKVPGEPASCSSCFRAEHKENTWDMWPTGWKLGDVCRDGTMSGRSEWRNQFGHQLTSWSFSLQGTEEPQHVTAAKNLLIFFDVEQAVDKYRRSLIKVVPLREGTRKQVADWYAIQRTLLDAVKTKSSQAEPVYQKLRSISSEAHTLWSITCRFWDLPDGCAAIDSKYASKVGEQKTALAEWIAKKRALETSLAAVTEDAAVKLEKWAPHTASDYRGMAQRLLQNGLEKFVATTSGGTWGSSPKAGWNGGRNH